MKTGTKYKEFKGVQQDILVIENIRTIQGNDEKTGTERSEASGALPTSITRKIQDDDEKTSTNT